MTGRSLSTDREKLDGIGLLVEGEAVVARVHFELHISRPPNGLARYQGTARPVPGSQGDLFDLWNRNAALTLSFPGGTWECYLQSPGTPDGEPAQLVNRGRLQLEDDPKE